MWYREANAAIFYAKFRAGGHFFANSTVFLDPPVSLRDIVKITVPSES